jgi:hypothetical protein
VLPKDYTIVMSRIGLVPKAALLHPTSAVAISTISCRPKARLILAREASYRSGQSGRVGREHRECDASRDGRAVEAGPVSPGLMVYLDQVKRNAADQALERYAARPIEIRRSKVRQMLAASEPSCQPDVSLAR